MYTLWHHCRIATMAAGHYQLFDDGAMLTDGAVLLWVGNRQNCRTCPLRSGWIAGQGGHAGTGGLS